MSRRQPMSRWGPPTTNSSSNDSNNGNSNANSTSGTVSGHTKGPTTSISNRGPPKTQSHHNSHQMSNHHNHNHSHNFSHGHNHNHGFSHNQNRQYTNNHRGSGRHFFSPRTGNHGYNYNRMSSGGRGFNKPRTDSQSALSPNQNHLPKNQSIPSAANNINGQENQSLRPGTALVAGNTVINALAANAPTIPEKFRVPPPAGPWNNVKSPPQNVSPNSTATGQKTTITPSAPSLPPNFRADVLKPSPLLHGEIISKDVNMAAPQRFQQKIAKSTLNPPNKVRNNNSNPGNVDTNKNSTIYNTNIGANTSINSGMDSTKVPIANKKNPDNPDRTNIPRDEGQTSRIQQLKSQSPHSIPYSKNKGLSGHANAVLNSVPPPVHHHPPATASSSSNNQYQTNSYHRNLTYVRKNTTTENKNSYNNIKSNENNRYNYGANNANSPKRYSNNNQMYHRNLNNEHGYNKSTMPFTKKGQRPLVNHYSNHNEKSFVNKDNFVSTMEKPALVSKFAEGFDKNRLSNIQVDSNFNKRDLSRKNSGPLPSSPSRKRYRPISPSIHHAPHHTPQHPQQHQHPPPHHIHSHKQSLQQQYHAQKSHSSNYAVHSDSNLQKLPPPHLHPPLPQDVPGLNKKSSTIQSPPPPQKIVLPNQNVSSPKSSDVKSKGSESGTVQSPTTTITPGSPKAAPPSSSILALSRYIDASSQMEFAYAKFLYLSKKHDNIKKKIEFVQSLPIGQECFHDDLEALQLNSPNIDLNELGINLKRNRRSLGSSDRKRRSATSSSSNGKERHSIG